MKTASTSWTQDWPAASGTTTSQVVRSLTNGTPYTFEVRAYNKVGSGTAASESATPQQPNRTPVVSCPSSASVAENSTGTVASCTASDPDGDTLTWSVSGTNASAFQLQGSGASRTLHFRSAPNYETKSSYQVRVKVSDGSLADSVDVAVSVTDVNEAPSVSVAENSTGTVGGQSVGSGLSYLPLGRTRPTRTPRTLGRVPVSAEHRSARPRGQNGPDSMTSRGARL